MSGSEKENILHFVTYTRMFILQEDKMNIISFIHGFEAGAGKQNFTKCLSELLSGKYNFKYDNEGWIGQIKRLAEKNSCSWVLTFKHIALELIFSDIDDRFKEELFKGIEKRIWTMINRVEGPWFDERWVEDWNAMCPIKKDWYSALWTSEEREIMLAIDDLVQSGNLYQDTAEKKASDMLLELKAQYQKIRPEKEVFQK